MLLGSRFIMQQRTAAIGERCRTGHLQCGVASRRLTPVSRINRTVASCTSELKACGKMVMLGGNELH
jgi:hypothetical protein